MKMQGGRGPLAMAQEVESPLLAKVCRLGPGPRTAPPAGTFPLRHQGDSFILQETQL